MIIKDLKREIIERRKNKEEIRKSIDKYCKNYYGIDNFSSIIDVLFEEQKKFGICLARQIPTVNTEHLAKHLFAKWLNFQEFPVVPISLGFTADSFSSQNDLKKSYCKIPYYAEGKRKYKWIINKENRGSLDGQTLAKVLTANGKTLSGYHQNLREKVFGNDRLEIDVSSFFLECLQECFNGNIEKPEYIFVDDGKREKLVETRDLNGQKILRPQAGWYYPLYLMMFVDGSRALLSTVDDDEKVSSWFKEVNRKTKEITGFSPLIIYTPKGIELKEHKSNLVEVPKWILQDAQWRDRIEMPPNDSTFFKAYEFFEKRLLEFRE